MTMFARRLRDRREQLGWTQAKLGEKIGVSSQTISAYEKNIFGNGKTPTLDKVVLLAEVLDVSVDWLCGISVESHSIDNYGDIVDIIELMAEAVCLETSEHEETPDFFEIHGMSVARIDIYDEVLVHFFEKRKKMAELLADGTIDNTLYNSWLEGEKSQMTKLKVQDKPTNKDDDDGSFPF
ncbi:helix-turn-helix transcriptional regulator [Clostridiaceae bacterium OttesenSCG-928-D20]|nr:helix-turn-helix transcriptional regulator [Clostridiaceae bacterium OttesenSCG-928-D20]